MHLHGNSVAPEVSYTFEFPAGKPFRVIQQLQTDVQALAFSDTTDIPDSSRMLTLVQPVVSCTLCRAQESMARNASRFSEHDVHRNVSRGTGV